MTSFLLVWKIPFILTFGNWEVFKEKDFQKARHTLGLHFEYMNDGLIFFNEDKYDRSIYHRFSFSDRKVISQSNQNSNFTSTGKSKSETTQFQEILGSFLCSATNTQPDISIVAYLLSQSMVSADRKLKKLYKSL
jgi:hypothetical protein